MEDEIIWRSMMGALALVKNSTKWLLRVPPKVARRPLPSVALRLKRYRPHISVQFESDDFFIKTVENGLELERVLRLRHDIFLREWQGRQHPSGLDLEEWDFHADHLMIVAKKTNQVIGTYRLLSDQFASRFYSQNEFDLSEFLIVPGGKLEMGRAGVHADFRNGNTLDLLWKGLAQYVEKLQVRYLFGCTSIKSNQTEVIAALFSDFKSKKMWSDEFSIRPLPQFQFNWQETDILANDGRDLVKTYTPPLLRSYFHAGAKVFGLPALDREFACFDVLTILDLTQLQKRFRSRYLEGQRIALDSSVS